MAATSVEAGRAQTTYHVNVCAGSGVGHVRLLHQGYCLIIEHSRSVKVAPVLQGLCVLLPLLHLGLDLLENAEMGGERSARAALCTADGGTEVSDADAQELAAQIRTAGSTASTVSGADTRLLRLGFRDRLQLALGFVFPLFTFSLLTGCAWCFGAAATTDSSVGDCVVEGVVAVAMDAAACAAGTAELLDVLRLNISLARRRIDLRSRFTTAFLAKLMLLSVAFSPLLFSDPSSGLKEEEVLSGSTKLSRRLTCSLLYCVPSLSAKMYCPPRSCLT
mmetsp:Transcript_2575/g.7724  ORF Transcript_2575/g.7724 Transcript_2575/m.7724 type:complete len:277 (-) Transcript_2575:338-1168(-)